MLRTAIAFSLTFAIIPAHATDIYKCVDPAGKVEYRNTICASGTQSAALDTPVATGRTLEIRRRSDERDLRRDAGSKEIQRLARAPRVPPSVPVNALPPPPTETQK